MKTNASQQRKWVLGIALLLTLACVFLVEDSQEETTSSSKSKVSQVIEKSSSPSNTDLDDLPLLPDLSGKNLFTHDQSLKSQDIFKAKTWYLPPPPKPVEVQIEKPAPVAPPVPFFYVGKLEDSLQGKQIFLTANNKIMSVWIGKNVDPVWRLDKEDANTLTFTYIPLGLVKVLSKAMRQPAIKNLVNESNPDGTN
jgi:hypothetical protein